VRLSAAELYTGGATYECPSWHLSGIKWKATPYKAKSVTFIPF